MVLPAGLSPASPTFEASRFNTLSYGSIKIGLPAVARIHGQNSPPSQETTEGTLRSDLTPGRVQSEGWSRREDLHFRGALLPGSLRNCRRVQTPVAAEPRRHGMACQAGARQGEKPAYALACFGAAAFATRCADGEGWWVATVLPRALRFKRPLHRCNACNPGARPEGPRHEGGVEPPRPGL